METKPHSWDYVVRSGIAGGIAGCAAKTLIAPMDRVKILFQTREPRFVKWSGSPLGLPRAARYIVQKEGISGLFTGHSATLARVFPYAAIKFVAYEQFRALLIPNKRMETHARRFLAGSLSGVVSVIFTYPLDVIRVQMAYQGSNPSGVNGKGSQSLIKSISKIWVQSPNIKSRIASFYPGFAPTLIGILPYAGVSFFAHDLGHDIFGSKWLRKIAVVPPNKDGNSHSRPQLKAWAQMIAGGVSGVVAQTAAYPMEITRRRMQVNSLVSDQKINLRNTMKMVYKESGFRGFFVGLSIGFLKVGPMFACSFYVYERMKYLLDI